MDKIAGHYENIDGWLYYTDSDKKDCCTDNNFRYEKPWCIGRRICRTCGWVEQWPVKATEAAYQEVLKQWLINIGVDITVPKETYVDQDVFSIFKKKFKTRENRDANEEVVSKYGCVHCYRGTGKGSKRIYSYDYYSGIFSDYTDENLAENWKLKN